jgi:hypothetical protein
MHKVIVNLQRGGITKGLVPGELMPCRKRRLFRGSFLRISQAADYSRAQHYQPACQEYEDQNQQRVIQQVGSGDFVHAELNWNTALWRKLLRVRHTRVI